jgi:hypothetical protein
MVRIGVTGHREIPGAARAEVRRGILAHLRGGARHASAAEALSCLAAGADQMFADLALRCGIPLTAVIPGMPDYEQRLDGEEARTSYHRLLKACASRAQMPFEPSDEDAYLAAGRWIVDHCDLLVAVWDGRPARGRGGTGDIVAYARRSGVPVAVVWSPGVRRA